MILFFILNLLKWIFDKNINVKYILTILVYCKAIAFLSRLLIHYSIDLK